MSIQAKYMHTNLIAEDWRRLAAFYQEVFGCIPIPPERDLKGEKLEAGTGIPGAHLRGVHLRLPGHAGPVLEGPTLEVFQYDPVEQRAEPAVNRPGYRHIAFLVEDVAAAKAAVLAAGGGTVGQMVTTEITGGAQVTWIYVTDPEGNIIELQSWAKQAG